MMKKIFAKRQMLLAVLVLALGLAVYLNYSFAAPAANSVATNGTTTSTTAAKADDDHLGDAMYVGNTTAAPEIAYFSQARKNRENARQEAMDMVTDLMNSAKIGAQVQAQVAQKLQAMADAVDQESKIENLICAKGFPDCVVYIADEHCHVVVQADALDTVKTAQITDIVVAQSDVAAKNISITAVNS